MLIITSTLVNGQHMVCKKPFIFTGIELGDAMEEAQSSDSRSQQLPDKACCVIERGDGQSAVVSAPSANHGSVVHGEII